MIFIKWKDKSIKGNIKEIKTLFVVWKYTEVLVLKLLEKASKVKTVLFIQWYKKKDKHTTKKLIFSFLSDVFLLFGSINRSFT